MSTQVIRQAAVFGKLRKPFIYITILKTEGSASRSQGSMLVDAQGAAVGTVGGGETEAYATKQALDLLSSNEAYRRLTFVVHQPGIPDAGKVHLLLVACTTAAVLADWARFAEWEQSQKKHVLGVQIKPEVALLGLCEDGSTIGNVHDMFLEQAQAVLEHASSRFLEFDGWACHLSMPVNQFSILLVGGGHVNQAVARLARFIDLSVQVVETRAEFATADLFPEAKSLTVEPTIVEGLKKVSIDKSTACVIASHAFDEEAARYLLRCKVPYLGVLGSRHKAKRLFKLLGDAQNTLFCPIGLDLGSETPEEIAVSVIAEIMKIQNKVTGQSLKHQSRNVILVRGGGDLATGTIVRLHRSGYRVIVSEVDKPTVIRTTVSLAQAMYDGTAQVEDVRARRVKSVKEAFNVLDEGVVPLLADPDLACLSEIGPVCVIDAIIAKRNLGTRMDLAPLVIALGPGFEAGVDAHVVVETMRGHSLGRILRTGSALQNTGVPGLIEGFGKERVLHTPKGGLFKAVGRIGDIVKAGDIIAYVDETPLTAPIDGMIRGMLNSGLTVSEHFKIADIDPRGNKADFLTISDKAYAIAGAVLEVVDCFINTL